MKIRLLYTLLVAALTATAAFAIAGLPANAETQTIMVRLETGELVPVQVDVPPGTPLEDIEIPDVDDVLPDEEAPDDPTTPTTPNTGTPESTDQEEQEKSRTRDRAKKEIDKAAEILDSDSQEDLEGPRDRKRTTGNHLRNSDGSPTRQNPTFFDALPGPSQITGVPTSSSRSTRPPASSTAFTGRCSRRSTRSRPTTAAI
jgi:hypothetical protein